MKKSALSSGKRSANTLKATASNGSASDSEQSLHASSSYRPLTIFLVNFDWRDIYRTSRIELTEKLERDRWDAQHNNFFFFSWARKHYLALEGQYRTVHQRTFGLEHVRPLLDLYACFAVPYAAWRYRVRPDVWSTYDFGNVPALWVCTKLFGGVLVPVINNQPTIYSGTRRFGRIKQTYSWVVERIGARLVDHVLTLNATMKQYLRGVGVPGDRMTVFSMNTISRDQTDIERAVPGRIRAEYQVPHDAKVLLCVARLEAEKNLDTLLTLFAALGPGYVLFILGRGSLLDPLKRKAEEFGIADRVHFTGYVHRDHIWNYYRDADLFVLLSNAEALGVVLWEAMYLHVPVIGSNVDGIVESVGTNSERGLIWKHGEGPERFKELVVHALADSPERTRMLRQAREFVDDQLRNPASIYTVYEKLIAR